MGIRFTSGTLLYEIPIPNPYRLKRAFPLVIEENEDGFLIECPFLDEYGYGETYDKALNDLGSSIVDFWHSLMKLTKRGKKLGDSLQTVFVRLNENIVEEA